MKECRRWLLSLAQWYERCDFDMDEHVPRTRIMLDPDLANARKQDWWSNLMLKLMGPGQRLLGSCICAQVYTLPD